MQAVKAIYDGKVFCPLLPVRLKEGEVVMVVLPEPKKQGDLLRFLGLWKDIDEPAIDLEQIYKEREYSSMGRPDPDDLFGQ